MEKSLTELSEIFDTIGKGALGLYNQVLKLESILKVLATVLEDVDAQQRAQLASNPAPSTHMYSRFISWVKEMWGGRPADEVSCGANLVSDAIELMKRDSTVAHITTSHGRISMRALEQNVGAKLSSTTL